MAADNGKSPQGMLFDLYDGLNNVKHSGSLDGFSNESYNDPVMTTEEYNAWLKRHPEFDLDELARIQSKGLGRLILLIVIWVGVIFGSAYILKTITNSLWILPAILLIMAVATFGVIKFGNVFLVDSGADEEFMKGFFEDFPLACLGDVFSDVEYDRKEGITREELIEEGVFRNFDITSSSGISAEYQGISFYQSDINIVLGINTKGGSNNRDVSQQGRLLFCENSKTVETPVVVIEKEEFFRKSVSIDVGFGSIDTTPPEPVGPDFVRYNKSKKFETESVEFNEEFACFGDELTGFYVLTPIMMDAIMEIKSRTRGEVFVIFKDDEIILGVFDGDPMFGIFENIGANTGSKLLVNAMKDVYNLRDNIKSLRNLKGETK